MGPQMGSKIPSGTKKGGAQTWVVDFNCVVSRLSVDRFWNRLLMDGCWLHVGGFQALIFYLFKKQNTWHPQPDSASTLLKVIASELPASYGIGGRPTATMPPKIT